MALVIKVALLLIGVIYNTMIAFEFRKIRWRFTLSLATASLLFGLIIYLLVQRFEWLADLLYG